MSNRPKDNQKLSRPAPGGQSNPGSPVESLLVCVRVVLQSLDFEDAARAIYAQAKTLIGATAGYTALLSADGTRNEVLFLDAGGMDCRVDPALPMPIRGLREMAYTTGQAVYDNDFGRSPWMAFMPEGHAPLDNVLFTPLMIEGKACGLIGLANKPGGFTDADARLAELIGEVAAIALNHHHNRNQLLAANTALDQRVRDKTHALSEANARLLAQIGQHRRAVAALKQSEARYRLLAENATDMISRHSPDGIYRYASPACNTLLGYRPGELIGRNAYEFFHPDDFDAIHRSHTTALETRQTTTVAYRIRRCDDSFVWVETTSRSVLDPKTGQVLEITATTRDISERKAFENQLFASRETQRALLDASTESAILIDRKAVILAINETGARRLNGSPQDLVGRCALDLVPPEVAVRRKNALDRVLQTGKPLIFQDQRNGMQLEHSVHPIFGPNGRVERLAIFARDITFQFEAEAALRQSEARYRALVESSEDHIFILSTAMVFEFSNHRGDLFDGDANKSVIGKTLHEVFPGELALFYSTKVRQVLDTGMQVEFEHPMPLAGEDHIHLDTLYPIWRGGKIWAVGGICRDISEQKQAQQALIQSQTRLQVLTSLLLEAQEKERSRISRELHDQLGQDLMVLKLQVQAMTKALDRCPWIDAQGLVRSIDLIADNLRRLTRDLSPAVLEDLGLAPALRWQINEIARHAGLKVRVRYPLFENLVARDQEILVYRIVQEAMTNIVRHAGASNASISLRKNGQGRQIAISDNGKGFDPAAVAANDPARRGLGMAAMDERARMLGGQLRIESAPGKGTVVFLELPGHI